MIHVEMEVHAKMDSTNTFVSADLVMRVVSVKGKWMNVHLILANMEVHAIDTSTLIHVHALRVLMAVIAKKISTIVS